MRSFEDVLQDYEAVIGLEVHTELTTLNSKMFCSCKLSHSDEPNTNVCPICLGLPGALPTPNKAAIESIVMAGLATNCDIKERSMFYRKNYFYPDMAKNFQTTQGPVAFCMDGQLELEVLGRGAAERPANEAELGFCGVELPSRQEDGSYTTPIRIERIHMEEDAAKMLHLGGEEGRIASATESLIDYNRCGTPLIELVTRPDLRTPEEARLFMEKLRQIFLTLRISDCSLEKGSMRCDGNVSLRRRGSSQLGTKTELKNINSFKSLHDGLMYEICRQAEILDDGGQVRQETRHFEPSKKRTIVLRVKETAADYRLFPEPDLAPFDLSEDFIQDIRQRLPELPDQKAYRYEHDFGIKHADALQISASLATSALFEDAVALACGLGSKTKGSSPQNASGKNMDQKQAQALANLVVNELAGYLNAQGVALEDSGISAAQLAGLAKLLGQEAITYKQGREVFELMASTGEDPEDIVDARGMRQVNDTSALEPVVSEVLASCESQVQQYRDGNTKVVGYLIGQCMKASRGKGNPKLFGELLRAKLG